MNPLDKPTSTSTPIAPIDPVDNPYAVFDKPEDERTVDDEIRFLSFWEKTYYNNELNEDHLRLHLLYGRGEYDELYKTVEELTEANLVQDPAYQAYIDDIAAIRNRRKAGGPAETKALSNQIAELEARHRELLLIEANVPAEAALGKMEKAREAIRQTLHNALGDEYTSEQALTVLGIKEDGKNIFHYPADLMPQEVNEEWVHYLNNVCKHLILTIEMHDNPHLRQDWADADNVRKTAHDTVTRSVHHVLGLDAERADIRQVLANARETTMREHGYKSTGSTITDLKRIQAELQAQYAPEQQ